MIFLRVTEIAFSCGISLILGMQIASIVDIVESAIAERSNEDNRLENLAGGDQKHRDEFASDEVRQLRAELENKSMEIERLSSRLNGIEKVCLFCLLKNYFYNFCIVDITMNFFVFMRLPL